MSSPIHDSAHETGRDTVTATAGEPTSKASSARHGAGLFDIRNIIGLLMVLYGVILVITSFMTSEADRAKADGANLNLWTGLGLLALGAALIGWALARPIVVDEAELAHDKAVAETMGNPHVHH